MTTTFGYMIFYVADVEATVRFYEAGFGMVRRFVSPENDYGEMETGTTTLAFVSNELADQNLSAAGGFSPLDSTAPPIAAAITLITEDIAAAMARAEQAGARRYTEPTEKPWGQTVAYLRDPDGILVEVGTPIAANTP